ncbi:integrin beta-2-like [Halichondria panicea]|uniref:integrin beta-2-like n=1 Tax=Halichondria panicea TaxID=6063 RepID=UPI00312B6DE4
MINRASVLWSLSGAILLAICLQGNAQLCERQRGSCRSCISTLGCSWCTDMIFNGTSRCFNSSTSIGCALAENPSGSVGNATNNIGDGNPVNIKNIDLTLRVGQAQEFSVSITALRNLPLDLYILMDLSGSMSNVLASVQEIAGDITGTIQNITNNVQLGFGSFNDKVLLPFTNPVIIDPLESYAFRHRIDFTSNIANFESAINSVVTTINLDASENTLEALAQVISCDSLLGWRSRNNTQVARLVLLMTDQGFHFSGEGKLAGILQPYRGECLLERMPGVEQIDLLKFDTVDYPSVGQIVDLIRRQDINVIFNVLDNVRPTYEELVAFTNERATVASLQIAAGGGQEILNTIEDEYRRLLREIILEQLNPSDQFSITITPMCPAGSNLTMNGNGCDGVQLDETAVFTVSVTLNNCNELGNGETRVLLFESRAFGTFTVTVFGVCQCDCEEDEVENAARCSGNGAFSCGVCVCNEPYCGTNCSLIIDPNNGGGANNCPLGGSVFGNQMCSGRGDCDCACNCDRTPGTFGTACECDTFSVMCMADENDNEICSGRGMCCNEECDCGMSPQGNRYRGRLCECEPAEEICTYNEQVCNSQGTCQCNGCDCNNDWGGLFCEIPRLTRCVGMGVEIDTNCIIACRESDPIPDQCVVDECNVNRPTLFVNMAEIETDTENAVEAIANSRLDSASEFRLGGNSSDGTSFICTPQIGECTNTYYILDNGTHIAIVVEREQDCPAMQLPIPAYAIGIISLGVLILLGILIIILVKIIFVILDYIEVQRWQREAGEADFSKNQNPLYQSPEMQYTNVAYGKAL